MADPTSDEDKAKFRKKLEDMTSEQITDNMKNFGPPIAWKKTAAEQELQKRKNAQNQKQIDTQHTLAKEANDIAREANTIAKTANDKAEEANKISACSRWISAISMLIAVASMLITLAHMLKIIKS